MNGLRFLRLTHWTKGRLDKSLIRQKSPLTSGPLDNYLLGKCYYTKFLIFTKHFDFSCPSSTLTEGLPSTKYSCIEFSVNFSMFYVLWALGGNISSFGIQTSGTKYRTRSLPQSSPLNLILLRLASLLRFMDSSSVSSPENYKSLKRE